LNGLNLYLQQKMTDYIKAVGMEMQPSSGIALSNYTPQISEAALASVMPSSSMTRRPSLLLPKVRPLSRSRPLELIAWT
jgi:hypothetical protein